MLPLASLPLLALFPSEPVLLDGVRAAVRTLKIYRYPLEAQYEHTIDYAQWHYALDKVFGLLPDAVWTREPSVADFFVLPFNVFGHWGFQPAAYALKTRSTNVPTYMERHFLAAAARVVYGEPWFNRSGGEDHLFAWPLAPFATSCGGWGQYVQSHVVLQILMEKSTKLGHYGWYDEHAPSGSLDANPFYWRYGVDIAVPVYGVPRNGWTVNGRLTRSANDVPRPTLYYTGSFGRTGYCSMHIRHYLFNYFSLDPENPQKVLDPTPQNSQRDYVPLPQQVPRCPMSLCTREWKRNAWFAAAPAGSDCWSARLNDIIEKLTIPLIMADGEPQPFDALLDWSTFAIWLNTSELQQKAARWNANATTASSHRPTLDRIVRLGEVREWFRWEAMRVPRLGKVAARIRTAEGGYDWSQPIEGEKSATGLLLLELLCRAERRRGKVPPACHQFVRQRAPAAAYMRLGLASSGGPR